MMTNFLGEEATLAMKIPEVELLMKMNSIEVESVIECQVKELHVLSNIFHLFIHIMLQYKPLKFTQLRISFMNLLLQFSEVELLIKVHSREVESIIGSQVKELHVLPNIVQLLIHIQFQYNPHNFLHRILYRVKTWQH